VTRVTNNSNANSRRASQRAAREYVRSAAPVPPCQPIYSTRLSIRPGRYRTLTLASGRDKISGREIFWRLRISPHLEQCEGRNIARVIRALGWVRVRYGPQKRIWGWRWREWNVSHVKIDLNS
jgi:hypothetical protein